VIINIYPIHHFGIGQRNPDGIGGFVFKSAVAIVSVEIIFLPHAISSISNNYCIQVAIVVHIGKARAVRTVVVQYNVIIGYGCKSAVSIIYIKHIVLPIGRPVCKKNIIPTIAVHIYKIGTSRGGRGGGNIFKGGFLKGLCLYFFDKEK